jgi:hypothetical protein
VEGIDSDDVLAEQAGEVAVRHQLDVMPLGEDDVGVGMDLARLEPRHAMVEAARQIADLRMQCAAERHVHLLEAAADAEERHPAREAGRDERQCDRIAVLIIRLVTGMGLLLEPGRMDVGAGTREQDAIDDGEEIADVGHGRRSREHQRKSPGDLGHGPEVVLTDELGGEAVFHVEEIADHPNHRPCHGLSSRVHGTDLFSQPSAGCRAPAREKRRQSQSHAAERLVRRRDRACRACGPVTTGKRASKFRAAGRRMAKPLARWSGQRRCQD